MPIGDMTDAQRVEALEGQLRRWMDAASALNEALLSTKALGPATVSLASEWAEASKAMERAEIRLVAAVVTHLPRVLELAKAKVEGDERGKQGTDPAGPQG